MLERVAEDVHKEDDQSKVGTALSELGDRERGFERMFSLQRARASAWELPPPSPFSSFFSSLCMKLEKTSYILLWFFLSNVLDFQAQLVGDTAPLAPGWLHWLPTTWSEKNKPQESQQTEHVSFLDSFKLSPTLTPCELYLRVTIKFLLQRWCQIYF